MYSAVDYAAETPRQPSAFPAWMLNALSVVVLVFALQQLGSSLWIHTKAQLAQVLIKKAWEETLAAEQGDAQSKAKAKPWPWADTWPVARLQYANADRQEDLYVLAGAQGNSLAFGPGHLYGSSLPGTIGVSIVGGHRDTHFAFLEHVSLGDTFTVTTRDGSQQSYVVRSANVANSLTDPLTAIPYDSQLILVTCYPFDAVNPDGPLRYVVRAEPLSSETLL